MAKKTTNNFDIKQLLDNSGSYKNLVYGAITVLVLAVIVFLGIRTLSQNQGDINEGAVTIDEATNSAEYEVAEGETLWSISEKVYGTGFNWQMIAEANDISDPNDIEKGMKLTIPELTPTVTATGEEGVTPTVTMAQEVSPTVTQAITKAPSPTVTGTTAQEPVSNAKEYTVAQGDSLWKIAVAQYNDGYKWVDIAKANKLVNPNVIHVGNKLVLPR